MLPGRRTQQQHQQQRREGPTCEICGRQYNTRDKLNAHLFTHHNMATKVQCPICPKSFTRRDVMKLHYKRVHFTQSIPKGVRLSLPHPTPAALPGTLLSSSPRLPSISHASGLSPFWTDTDQESLHNLQQQSAAAQDQAVKAVEQAVLQQYKPDSMSMQELIKSEDSTNNPVQEIINQESLKDDGKS